VYSLPMSTRSRGNRTPQDRSTWFSTLQLAWSVPMRSSRHEPMAAQLPSATHIQYRQCIGGRASRQTSCLTPDPGPGQPRRCQPRADDGQGPAICRGEGPPPAGLGFSQRATSTKRDSRRTVTLTSPG
jgi:hypothetical protein